MKILQFTQKLLKLSAIVFIIKNIEDLPLVDPAIYVILGSGISISLSVLFYFHNKKVPRLFTDIEPAVNESKFSVVSN